MKEEDILKIIQQAFVDTHKEYDEPELEKIKEEIFDGTLESKFFIRCIELASQPEQKEGVIEISKEEANQILYITKAWYNINSDTEDNWQIYL